MRLGPVGALRPRRAIRDVGVGGEAEPAAARGRAAAAIRRAPGIVGAHDGGLGPAGELDERVLERRHRAVALEVVGLDVVHDRDGRMQREKRLVVLVGLDHEEVVARQPGVAAPGAHPPAGDPGGRSPAAVSASVVMTVVVVLPCVPDTATDARRRSAPASASFRGTTGSPSAARARQLRMLGRNRGGDHHGARAVEVGRIVALPDVRAHARRGRPRRSDRCRTR